MNKTYPKRYMTSRDTHLDHSSMPNYPADLNAMHEVEGTLDKDETRQFQDILIEIVRVESPSLLQCCRGEYKWAARWTWHAKARQRCVAFIAAKQTGEVEHE